MEKSEKMTHDCANDSTTVFVDNEDQLIKAVTELSTHSEVAFDTEGVELGRNGRLTIATFGGLDTADAPIYVVDVLVLGGERVFSRELPSFRCLLEDITIKKVTFDCRCDSDALLHQFDVRLRGVLDLQVFDQAARIHTFGEAPPERCPYVKVGGGTRYLQGVESVLARYPDPTNNAAIRKLPAPHRDNTEVWGKRPLSADAVAYAAVDVHINKVLLERMREHDVSDLLMQGVFTHSRRYEGQFRDRPEEVNRLIEKDFVMEEHAIVSASDLPADHPRICPMRRLQGRKKWDDAVTLLQSDDRREFNRAFNLCLFVFQHDDWYTEEGLTHLRQLVRTYPYFTRK